MSAVLNTNYHGVHVAVHYRISYTGNGVMNFATVESVDLAGTDIMPMLDCLDSASATCRSELEELCLEHAKKE